MAETDVSHEFGWELKGFLFGFWPQQFSDVTLMLSNINYCIVSLWFLLNNYGILEIYGYS